MARNRYDETWHRLRDWTKGQPVSERLAAQALIAEGYTNFDPSHPLGGRDGGKDGLAFKKDTLYAMAAYFPRGQKSISEIKAKFEADLGGARANGAKGIAFVTNQELSLAERETLRGLSDDLAVDLFHLERMTTILDRPDMATIREQFLDIEREGVPPVQLGGQGGNAQGAGGGGGGVIGTNAKGGPGGPGGKTTIIGSPPIHYGAGGGGMGVIGDEAVGGGGGGGGEEVIAHIGPEETKRLHHIDIHVGKGGVEGTGGEDTIADLVDAEGRIIRSLVARGGEPGSPAYIPPQSRVPTQADIDAGLRVTVLIACEYIRVKDRLVTIVDGGWDLWQVSATPFTVTVPLLVEIASGSIASGTVLELKLVVRRPDNMQVLEMKRLATVDRAGRRFRFTEMVEFSSSMLVLLSQKGESEGRGMFVRY